MSLTKRRAKFVSFIIPFVVFLIFFSISTSGARRAPWYEEALWNVISPPLKLFSAIGGGVGGVWDHYFMLVGASEENDKLKTKVAELEGQLIQTEEISQENTRLRELLSYVQTYDRKAVAASVVANDPRAEFKSIIIDKGSNDGIKPLMPVVGPKGVVGRIGEVYGGSSRVLLITDPNSAIDVLVQRSRARGLLVGFAKRTKLRPSHYLTRIEYLRRISDIKDGDTIITSGFDGVFPPGLPVGTAEELEKSRYGVFLDASVVPFENMAELQNVVVLTSSVSGAGDKS